MAVQRISAKQLKEIVARIAATAVGEAAGNRGAR